ncbi:MAG TPA: hypothetical protein VMP01_21405 [Pirellulaceae bacterium]|nr:hypothetical protein [Pirellulaceae bacterium]
MSIHARWSRRTFVAAAGAAAVTAMSGRWAQSAETPRPKVAAVFTELRLRSHAYNFLVNLLGKILFRGQWVDSGVDVVSFYADQFPDGDMARDVSRRFGVPLFDSIDKALCVGGKELAVDAVLLVGEHGDYPANELGQVMYPRKEFFDQCAAVMKRSGRSVPLFNDKHLSYRWDWAKEMYDTARELKMPLMAGSSVPLAARIPPLELPADAELEEAVSIHGGGLESYDFHALEVLQSFLESRRGGESGISRVQLLAGKEYEKAVAEGRWSQDLVAAAMEAERKMGGKWQPWPKAVTAAKVKAKARVEPPRGNHALVVTYRDGTKGTVLKIDSSSNRWNFACRLKEKREPLATALFNGPWGNLNLFSALSRAICHFFRTGKSPYPVERTLLVSGILDAAMHSHHALGKPIATPHLEFPYAPQDFSAFRETGESWQVITIDTPQPTTFAPKTM